MSRGPFAIIDLAVEILQGRDRPAMAEDLEGAADTLRAQLEAAEAEVAKLRTANVVYSQQVNELIGRAGNAEARAEAAEAECARLRANFVADAEAWGDALNAAGWKFLDVCPEKSTVLFNHCKPALRAAILAYAEAMARTKKETK